MRADGTGVRFSVIEDGLFLLTQISFFANLSVQGAQVILSQTAIFEETSNLVVNVLRKRGLVTILELEFADQHALELLTLLNVHEALTAGLAHA